jgi:hypothetical protein
VNNNLLNNLILFQYISNKTNNSLARKRLRLSLGASSPSSSSSSADLIAKAKATRKSLDDIVSDLKNIVVPRHERLNDINEHLRQDGINVDKLRVTLDLKTRRIYDDYVISGNGTSTRDCLASISPYSPSYSLSPLSPSPLSLLPYSYPSAASSLFIPPLTSLDRTRIEIQLFFNRDHVFDESVKNTWSTSIMQDDFLLCDLDPQKFLRDAKEWWARRGKKPPAERCGELYLARVR